MGTYCNGSGRKLDKPIHMVLASRSKLFLEGIRRVLENEADIKIPAEASNNEEIEKYLAEIKPDFLFLDNRTLNLDINKLLNLITKKSPDTKVILFGNHIKDELNYIIYITRETSSSELICTIKGLSKSIQTKDITDVTKCNLTKPEAKIVKLVGCGLSNKEIAKKLLIRESTVKTHLTHIFIKLGLQSRYQLIVYASRRRPR